MKKRWAAVGAVGLLFTAACGSGGDERDKPAREVDPVSSEIRSWNSVCDVFDPDAIMAELGGIYKGDAPAELGPRQGFFLGALKCNGAFTVKSDPEQTQSVMYLNLSPSDSTAGAKRQYDELWEKDFDSHSRRGNSAPMLASEEDMPGDWDNAAMFVSTGGDGDRVWAYYLKGSYMVQIQLIWGPDSKVRDAEVNGEDLSEAAEFDFTPLDIAGWVKNTYLPQTYKAIETKIAEGTRE